MTPVLCPFHVAVLDLAKEAISGHRRHKTLARIATEFARQCCHQGRSLR